MYKLMNLQALADFPWELESLY